MLSREARNKLAQIAAFEMSVGTPGPEIESKLLGMVSDLSQFELNAALAQGRVSLQMGQAINTGQKAAVEHYLDNLHELGHPFARVQAVFRIGPGPDDWRSVAPLFSVGQSLDDIIAETQAQVSAKVTADYGVDAGQAVASIVFRSLSPQG